MTNDLPALRSTSRILLASSSELDRAYGDVIQGLVTEVAELRREVENRPPLDRTTMYYVLRAIEEGETIEPRSLVGDIIRDFVNAGHDWQFEPEGKTCCSFCGVQRQQDIMNDACLARRQKTP